MNIPEELWLWFGSPGHFLCAHWCRFHLCTRVGKYLVSTVGAYVHPIHSMGSEQKEVEWLKDHWPGDDIGCDRKYETMVFKVDGICTIENCFCGQPTIDGNELDFRGYNLPVDANSGHLELCRLWATEEKQNELP